MSGGRSIVTCILLYTTLVLSYSSGSYDTANFNRDFEIAWSPDHVNTSSDGQFRDLKLDKSSGCAFVSHQKYLFGEINMKIKLIPGHPAGTVVAYYLQSNDGPTRDEIDFEFLGNVDGKPYVLQTNVFTKGVGYREERLNLWFDPANDFHNYTIHWSIHHIVLSVDGTAIRIFRNHLDKGVDYPFYKPMPLLASIWNGENWATNGGKDRIDWTKSPFIASFKDYKIDACAWNELDDGKSCRSTSNVIYWWNQDKEKTLSNEVISKLEWVRKNHMTYDYCQDAQRFKNQMPKECSLPRY